MVKKKRLGRFGKSTDMGNGVRFFFNKKKKVFGFTQTPNFKVKTKSRKLFKKSIRIIFARDQVDNINFDITKKNNNKIKDRKG